MESLLVKQEILDAFRLMWELHPAPAMLLRANRDILAVNALGREAGIPVGAKCFSLAGNAGACTHCRANVMLKEGKAVRAGVYSAERKCFMDGYWMPVAGEPGLYVHYGNDITEFVRPELLQPE